MMAITALFLRGRGWLLDVLVIVLVCNLSLLVPVALVWHYLEYGITTRSFLAFMLAGFVGPVLSYAFYSIGSTTTSSVTSLKATA